MKSRLIAVGSVLIASMLLLPMSALADITMRLDVWTDDVEYEEDDPVTVYAVWSLEDTGFDHTKCHVDLNIYEGSQVLPVYTTWGEYVPGPGGGQSGPLDHVWCDGWVGEAQDEWIVSDWGWYTVIVEVWAYDDSQSPPDDEIYGIDDASFVVWP